MAMQVVNPDAGTQEQPAPPLDGQKGEQALKRYRSDKGTVTDSTLLTNIR